MPELRLVEAADEHLELALVERDPDDYELRLRVLVGYVFSCFPVRNVGLYVVRMDAEALDDFLADLVAGRASCHGTVGRDRAASIAVMPVPAGLPMRDVILRSRPILGIPPPPVRTTMSGEALSRLREFRQHTDQRVSGPIR